MTNASTMTVWVAEWVGPEDTNTIGVFRTMAAAKAACDREWADMADEEALDGPWRDWPIPEGDHAATKSSRWNDAWGVELVVTEHELAD